MNRREIFDKIALSCISYLESFEECRGIDFQSADGASPHELSLWEKRNAPYKLPNDLKSFYSIFNGVYMGWNVMLGAHLVTGGEIRTNQLSEIQRIPIDGTFDTNKLVSNIAVDSADIKSFVAFTLDSLSEVGQIVMLYRPSSHVRQQTVYDGTGREIINSLNHEAGQYENPEIWFLDVSARWHFLCPTFTQFIRLMVTHLGVYGWQNMFTPEGASSSTRQWMRMFCKERLIIDRDAHSKIWPNK